ncbi:MAG: sel1 repeat family protein, partial [Ruminococcus flavefaciens]|nr:sel1 repeat family protein [Ruminococcus flavefaciens]
ASGNADARYLLAVCYENGFGVEQNQETAMQLFKEAAKNGSICAQNALGINLSEDKDGSVKKFFIPVYNDAESGNTMAQYLLGGMYSFGENCPKDVKKAFYWYKKAAEGGQVYAQFALACCFRRGDGIEEDPRQAVYWYEKAAEAGDAGAQSSLAECYCDGYGVAQDKSKAMFWYGKAKEQYEKAVAEGNKTAQIKLDILKIKMGVK